MARTAEPARLLEQLMAADHDADEVYRLAAERLADPRYRSRLEEFRADHRRHLRELEPLLRALGGTPPAGPDLTGRLEEVRLEIAQLGGDNGVLKAADAAARHAETAYSEALERAPADSRPVIGRALEDLRRHREWFIATVRSLERAPHRGVPPWNIPPPSGL